MPDPRCLFALLMALIIAAGHAPAQEPLNLWPGEPPGYVTNGKEEFINEQGGIENVLVPTLTVLPSTGAKNTGMALVVCPGGSYRKLGWDSAVVDTARYFNPKGITIIGLKYRVSPPYTINAKDRSLPLQDVKRAVQMVRAHAADWKIDPHKIGVLGFSAGANLTMTLADQFDEGDPASADPVAKVSNRPDFVVACALWHWHQTSSPFTFQGATPPVFMVHATDDPVAPVDLAYVVRDQLKGAGIPVHLDVYPEGRHGVAQLTAKRLEQHFPPSQWPEHLLTWLEGLGFVEPEPSAGN